MKYTFDLDVPPRMVLAVTGDSILDAFKVAFAEVTPPPPPPPAVAPFTPGRLPVGYVSASAFQMPQAPDGQVIKLSADTDSYTVSSSNTTLDLDGHRIGSLVFANGVSRVRATNGRVGTFSTPLANNADNPTLVNDIIVDRLVMGGGRTNRDGNAIRVGRFLMTNCSSIAATTSNSLDGLYTCALWVDPGSHDILVQDCDLWTYGSEACVRIEDSQRTVVHSSKLGCRVDKHCYRVHGHIGIGKSVDSWISDCELRNRGLMVATLPDSTGPRYDAVLNTYIKRCTIRMNLDGTPSQDASFGFPTSVYTPDGRMRLQNALVEDVAVYGTWDAIGSARTFGTQHPEMNWVFRNCTHTRIG